MYILRDIHMNMYDKFDTCTHACISFYGWKVKNSIHCMYLIHCKVLVISSLSFRYSFYITLYNNLWVFQINSYMHMYYKCLMKTFISWFHLLISQNLLLKYYIRQTYFLWEVTLSMKFFQSFQNPFCWYRIGDCLVRLHEWGCPVRTESCQWSPLSNETPGSVSARTRHDLLWPFQFHMQKKNQAWRFKDTSQGHPRVRNGGWSILHWKKSCQHCEWKVIIPPFYFNELRFS